MNAKIRELAIEAGLQPFEDCGPGYVYKMQKFAELIVRECIDISGSYYSVEGIAQNIVKDIKENFGIEE